MKKYKILIFGLLLTATTAYSQPVVEECVGLDQYEGTIHQSMRKMIDCIQAMTARINQITDDLLEG